MIGMQYKITLAGDYDMEIIKKRVKENGYKTDGFKDLLFKCYLIQEKNLDGFENLYAPFYLWKESEGLNLYLMVIMIIFFSPLGGRISTLEFQ